MGLKKLVKSKELIFAMNFLKEHAVMLKILIIYDNSNLKIFFFQLLNYL